MNVLDRLDELEREATTGPFTTFVPDPGQVLHQAQVLALPDVVVADYWTQADASLATFSRNHLRALIEVARIARDYSYGGATLTEMRDALAPLLAEKGGER